MTRPSDDNMQVNALIEAAKKCKLTRDQAIRRAWDLGFHAGRGARDQEVKKGLALLGLNVESFED